MKGERKKPTAMLTARPPQLEATFFKARILRLIYLVPLWGREARKPAGHVVLVATTFISGCHKAQPMSRLPYGRMLESDTRMPSPIRPRLRVLRWLIAVAIVILCLLLWGEDLLIASDPQPAHADAAIVLQGSIAAEKVRIAGAIDLLHRGVVDRVLLKGPKESYWGQ